MREDEKPPARYRSFLVRCWQERMASAQGDAVWRFSVMRVGSDDPRHAIGCLEDLAEYLREQLAGETVVQPGSPPEPAAESIEAPQPSWAVRDERGRSWG